MKNILTVVRSLIGLFLVTTCLSTGQLLAQEPGLEVPPVKKETEKQDEQPKVPEDKNGKPAFTPFGDDELDQPIDKEEALKQWGSTTKRSRRQC